MKFLLAIILVVVSYEAIALKLHHRNAAMKKIQKTSLSALPFDVSFLIPAAIASGVGYIVGASANEESITNIVDPFNQFLGGIPLVKNSLKKVLKQDLVLPNVKLPLQEDEAVEYFLTLTGTTSLDIVKFGLDGLSKLVKKFTGVKKYTYEAKNLFKEFQELYVNKIVKSPFPKPNLLPEDYNYFGTEDNVQTLETFIKNNPMFAAGLISNVDASGKLTFQVDPYGVNPVHGATRFSKFMSILDDNVLRATATFDTNMKLLDIQVYEGKNFATAKKVSMDKNAAAAALLYSMSFYGTNIHSCTHILHALLSTGIQRATLPSPGIHEWPYLANVYLKYVEVENLLYGGKSGGSYIEGRMYKSDGDKLRSTCREMVADWVSFTSAEDYVYKFVFPHVTREQLESAGISEQFRKQAALIDGFASELDAVFAKDPKYAEINKNIKEFYDQTELGGNIKDLKSWLALMSVSGMLHGSTNSLTRLLMTHDIFAIVRRSEDIFSETDSSVLQSLPLTNIGVCKNYHVFSSELPASIPYEITKVLKKYDDKSLRYKTDFYDVIANDPEFKNIGWILTDHGPNLVDAKQLSITAYI